MNPVPGLCPSCEDPVNSVFMQSIHSEWLFRMLSKRGDFKRNFLFCTPCIEWAKSEVLKLREPLRPQNPPNYSPVSEAGASRRTPDPFAVAESHHEPMVHADDTVGQRLAGYTESPVHLSHREYSIVMWFLTGQWGDTCIHFCSVPATLPYFLPSEARPAETPVMNRTPVTGPMGYDPWRMDDSRQSVGPRRRCAFYQQD